MNTVSDSIRVSHDLGPLRFSLKYLNKPTMSFKGSFFVCEHGVEKSITFDHGLEGSITEDAYFVVKAVNNGYSCDWIDGEMLEQSPLTFMDVIRQRRLWFQGAYYVAFSKNLKRDFCGTAYKLVYINSILSTIGTISFFLSLFFPVSFHPIDIHFGCLLKSCFLYFYWFGLIKNFNFNNICLSTKILLFVSAPVIIRYLDICNSIAFILALKSSNTDVISSHENKDKKI